MQSLFSRSSQGKGDMYVSHRINYLHVIQTIPEDRRMLWKSNVREGNRAVIPSSPARLVSPLQHYHHAWAHVVHILYRKCPFYPNFGYVIRSQSLRFQSSSPDPIYLDLGELLHMLFIDPKLGIVSYVMLCLLKNISTSDLRAYNCVLTLLLQSSQYAVGSTVSTQLKRQTSDTQISLTIFPRFIT